MSISDYICGSVSVCMYTYACGNKLWNVPCNYCISGERERERDAGRHTAAVLPQGSPQECSSTLIPSAAAGSIRGTEEGTVTHMHVISITKTRNHACTSLFSNAHMHMLIYQNVPFKTSRLSHVGHMVTLCLHWYASLTRTSWYSRCRTTEASS